MDVKKSSIVTNEVYTPKEDQFYLPSWGIVVVLVISFVILKKFIYTIDEKRHGK